jgi:threonine synthase
VVQVSEQEIMDSMIIANRNGNIACTQGGESMAGLRKAIQEGYVGSGEVGILDSTAHMLKFLTFQEMYFNDSFGPDYNVRPRSELKNAPRLMKAKKIDKYPEHGKPLHGEDLKQFIHETSLEIAKILNLEKIN